MPFQGRTVLAAVTVFALLSPTATATATTPPAPSTSPAPAAARAVVYVAPRGSDAAAGTRRAPFATVQHAVAALGRHGGGTVELRGGHYAQRVSLKDVSGITLTAAPGEHPVLDGSSLTVPDGRSAMVTITGSSNVTVRGLDITGYRTTRIDAMPIGIYVHGGDSGVVLSGNHVHDLGNHNRTLGSMDMNAHGIAVYGDSATRSVRNLRIEGNEVDHLTLGASESVVVNGNVDGWRITGNHIHDNNNIGIDAIGYEPTLPARYRYTDLNRARNGFIGSNLVQNIISEGNPAYYADGTYCNCADGIYIDGGTHITVADNTAVRDDIGIEVAAENPRGAADHVTVRDNLVRRSRFVGIATGGYCDGRADCGGVRTGKAFDNTFTGNTLRDDNTDRDGSPQFLIQYHESNDRITGNTVCAAGGSVLLLGTVPRSDSGRGDVVDRNVYAAAGRTPRALQWGWHGTTYTGWAPYRAGTGLDAHSALSPRC
ncbi:right-handed parallel beta-helix repeat-containing protein [Streptacidiphilus sp. PAMC 29251]